MPKKLPLGLQDFRGLIQDGYKYVDKTPYLYALTQSGKYFFLSRPRRFGKSLTISTLQALYSGSRDLFKGLWIENHWDWNKIHPTIHITLTGIGFVETGLETALHFLLDKLIREHELPPFDGAISIKFEYLIQQLAKQARVVVLIDEYDAPIIHYLGKDLDTAYANREILKEFYTVLKTNDATLELVFLTGVSKFSKTGIFSGLNNLVDLTMHPAYATMLGYTQQELEANFTEEIRAAAQKLNQTEVEVLAQLKTWYNGYRFHVESERVYNPVSVNNFLDRQEFENFWFATGTPTFLINLLKQQGVFDLHAIGQSTLDFDSFDLDDIRLFGILYQTGYLTIQNRDEFGQYTLDYPNLEVKNSMLAYLFEAFGGVSKGTGVSLAIKLERAFLENDLDRVFRILQEIFSHLPYFLHEKYPEKFFHAAIHLLFTYMGIRVHSEVCTSDGRADSMVETDSHIYILEYKLDKSPQEAINQILKKQYYKSAWEQGKQIVAIGVQFSSKTKNIENWQVQEV